MECRTRRKSLLNLMGCGQGQLRLLASAEQVYSRTRRASAYTSNLIRHHNSTSADVVCETVLWPGPERPACPVGFCRECAAPCPCSTIRFSGGSSSPCPRPAVLMMAAPATRPQQHKRLLTSWRSGRGQLVSVAGGSDVSFYRRLGGKVCFNQPDGASIESETSKRRAVGHIASMVLTTPLKPP